MECKRHGCQNPVRKREMTYCSKDCAPFGNFSREAPNISQKTVDERKAKADFQRKKLKQLADEGKSVEEAAMAISLAVGTVKFYCRKWRIYFRKHKRVLTPRI